MVIFSSQAKVKLEALPPQQARLLQRQLVALERSPNLLKDNKKVQRLNGLEDVYSLRIGSTYRVILEPRGNEYFVSDIINYSRLKETLASKPPASSPTQAAPFRGETPLTGSKVKIK